MTTSAARCPSCGGALKAGAQWCGLCYADLRPPPPPAPEPPPVPAPAAAPPVVEHAAAAPAAEGTPAGESAADAPAPKGWPCVDCGTMNSFELEVCRGCGLAFGSRLQTPGPALPGNRRVRLIVAVLIALLFMSAIALLSVATGGSPPPASDIPEVTVSS